MADWCCELSDLEPEAEQRPVASRKTFRRNGWCDAQPAYRAEHSRESLSQATIEPGSSAFPAEQGGPDPPAGAMPKLDANVLDVLTVVARSLK